MRNLTHYFNSNSNKNADSSDDQTDSSTTEEMRTNQARKSGGTAKKGVQNDNKANSISNSQRKTNAIKMNPTVRLTDCRKTTSSKRKQDEKIVKNSKKRSIAINNGSDDEENNSSHELNSIKNMKTLNVLVTPLDVEKFSKDQKTSELKNSNQKILVSPITEDDEKSKKKLLNGKLETESDKNGKKCKIPKTKKRPKTDESVDSDSSSHSIVFLPNKRIRKSVVASDSESNQSWSSKKCDDVTTSKKLKKISSVATSDSQSSQETKQSDLLMYFTKKNSNNNKPVVVKPKKSKIKKRKSNKKSADVLKKTNKGKIVNLSVTLEKASPELIEKMKKSLKSNISKNQIDESSKAKKEEKGTNTHSDSNIDFEARKKFLSSGIPDVVKKKMEAQKSMAPVIDDYMGEYTFPTVSHVQQLDNPVQYSMSDEFMNNLKEENKFELPVKFEASDYSFLINKFESPSPISFSTVEYPRLSFNVKREISLLKNQTPRCNIKKIYKSFKTVANRLNGCADSENWSKKYEPLSAESIIGNVANINRLKEWISSHKRMKKKDYDENSSEDDFVNSDDSDCSTPVKNNVAILSGPPGCGKTCAVYTIAEELGFKVLEINAGINRNGKRLLAELLESTQSHHVKRDIFAMNNNKSKKKSKNSRGENKIMMSLILIEDADVLFKNEDEGYLTAVNSLVDLSKRPVIFVANNIHYPHLLKYNTTENLVLYFKYPSWSKTSLWLQLIGLMEGVKLSKELMLYLFDTAGYDVRKNLLQLQLLLLSNFTITDLVSKSQPFRWLDLSSLNSIEEKKQENQSAGDLEMQPSDDESNNLENCKKEQDLKKYSDFLNHLSIVDALNPDFEEKYQVINSMQKTMDHLSDPQHTDNYGSSNLRSDIFEYLHKNLCSYYNEHESLRIPSEDIFETIRWRSDVYNSTRSVLSNIVPTYSHFRNGYCDYLPAIRTIAKSEEARLSGSVKRTSRYFNYLKSVNVDISEYESKILCKSFSDVLCTLEPV